MYAISGLVRAALLAVLALGVLALTTPVMAAASVSGADVPIAKPTAGTAPRGGTPPPVTTVGGSEPSPPGGALAGTGPSRPIIELTLLGAGLLVVGAAVNRAGRKPQVART